MHTTEWAVSLATDALFSVADTEKKGSTSCAQPLQKISIHRSHLNFLAVHGTSHQHHWSKLPFPLITNRGWLTHHN